jgi:hypothetical protein
VLGRNQSLSLSSAGTPMTVNSEASQQHYLNNLQRVSATNYNSQQGNHISILSFSSINFIILCLSYSAAIARSSQLFFQDYMGDR